MTPIDQTLDLEVLNALGPYNHGTWKGGGRSLGSEEALEGRAMHIVSTFVECMKKAFSEVQLAEMTMVDIGCYDGFLSVQIEKHIQFKKIVAIEPREKNIQKGEIARRYCGIQTHVEFRKGDILSLAESGEVFDIVFCSGVMHHLENVNWGIKSLKKACKTAIFIESQSYYSPKDSIFERFYDWFNRRIIEPKDIVYRFIPKTYGISGFKFETNYSDGSASGFSLVTVPSPETLQMTLEANGFADVQVLSKGADYRRHVHSKLRDFHAACLFARLGERSSLNQQISSYIRAHERDMTLAPVAPRMAALLKRCHAGKGGIADVLTLSVLGSKNPLIFKMLAKPFISFYSKKNYQREILSNFKFSIKDKTALETAKVFFHSGDLDLAVELLESLVKKANTDWRVTYRAFALLALIYKKKGPTEASNKYARLCSLANSDYPLDFILES